MHVGVDVVTISDVASSVETFGDRYLDSIFTPLEQELCAGQKR
jgi:holo-[acyl-carrier protein] synthase